MKTKFYKWIILVLGVLTVLCALGIGRFGFTLVIPAMKIGLGLTDPMVGTLVTISLIGYLAGAVASGMIVSIFDVKATITLSLALLGTSLFLLGLSRGYTAALVCVFFTGLGSGGANVAVMALPAFWFPPRRRGMATGTLTSGSSFGILIAGFAVPFLLHVGGTAGWRHSWIFMAAFVSAVTLGCLFFLKSRPTGDAATTPHQEKNKPGIGSVYKSKKIWHLGAIYFTFGFSYIIYTTFFGDYLINEVGLTPSLTGKIWSAVGAVSMISGLLWGTVSDRIGRKFGLAIVLTIQGAAYILFAVAGPGSTGALIYISVFLFAITAWSIPAIMAAASGDVTGKTLASAALGFITLIFGAGQAAGPFAAGRITAAAGTLGPVFFVTAGERPFFRSWFFLSRRRRLLKKS